MRNRARSASDGRRVKISRSPTKHNRNQRNTSVKSKRSPSVRSRVSSGSLKSRKSKSSIKKFA